MNLTDFKVEERQALLDLFVLGMYADGHLASSEDAQARRLLAELGYHTLDERSRELDAAITRVRRHAPSTANCRRYVLELAERFAESPQRRVVYSLLADLMGSDQEVAPAERQFLALVQEIFGI